MNLPLPPNPASLSYPTINEYERAGHNDFSTRCWLYYYEVLSSTELGAKISRFLRSDDRCKALEGKKLAAGLSDTAYEPTILGQWFLRRSDQVGEAQAWADLHSYLDNDQIDVTCTLWVLGLETPDVVELVNGVRLVPAKAMPDSSDKEAFVKFNVNSHAPRIQPLAALTKQCRMNKISAPLGQFAAVNTGYVDAKRELEQVAVLINALPGACCVPFFSAGYAADHSPIGLFGGSGGSIPNFDVLTHSMTKFPIGSVEELRLLKESYSAVTESEQARLGRILMRLSQAKRRLNTQDKILDLGITMEMLLLSDNKKNRISQRFKDRGDWLLSPTEPNARALLKEMYDLRSKVAHSGAIYGDVPQKVEAATKLLPELERLTEKVARRIIREGTPKWDSEMPNLAPTESSSLSSKPGKLKKRTRRT